MITLLLTIAIGVIRFGMGKPVGKKGLQDEEMHQTLSFGPVWPFRIRTSLTADDELNEINIS